MWQDHRMVYLAVDLGNDKFVTLIPLHWTRPKLYRWRKRLGPIRCRVTGKILTPAWLGSPAFTNGRMPLPSHSPIFIHYKSFFPEFHDKNDFRFHPHPSSLPISSFPSTSLSAHCSLLTAH
jgi:hypothetical protein